MEFAPYEKQSERNFTTGECIVKIWYDKQDETELLIRLLSFGPTLEILAPSEFRQKAAERIFRQFEMFN
jgi:predicted DNA-binding transcriptional regulator YafY